MSTALTDRVVAAALRLGVAAITANPSELDDMLTGASAAEVAKIKAYWASNPPTVIPGYPRHDHPVPLFAVTMASDAENSKYLASGEMALLDDDDVKTGSAQAERRTESIMVMVVANNYEIVSHYYRIARRILLVATRWLIEQGLDLPVISGADLGPDQQTEKEQLFARRLTITFEYVEEWAMSGALWEAFNDAEVFVTDPTKVDAYGPDVFFEDDDGDQFGGSITLLEEDE